MLIGVESVENPYFRCWELLKSVRIRVWGLDGTETRKDMQIIEIVMQLNQVQINMISS